MRPELCESCRRGPDSGLCLQRGECADMQAAYDLAYDLGRADERAALTSDLEAARRQAAAEAYREAARQLRKGAAGRKGSEFAAMLAYAGVFESTADRAAPAPDDGARQLLADLLNAVTDGDVPAKPAIEAARRFLATSPPQPSSPPVCRCAGEGTCEARRMLAELCDALENVDAPTS